jgi:hypothetical protein
LHEQDKLILFPTKWGWGVQLDSFRGFHCHYNGVSHCFSLYHCGQGIKYRGVKCQSVVSKYCHCIKVSGCQSVLVCCKDTGTVINTLLLDFKMLRLIVRQSRTPVSLQESRGKDFVIRGIEYKV